MGSRFTNTLYGLNLETLIWQLYPCEGTIVKARHLHTATAVGDHKIVVFGGRSHHDYYMHSFQYDHKFYCCDIRDGRWSQMATTGYRPIGRRSHIAACFRESIIYFGEMYNDVSVNLVYLMIQGY